MSEINGYNSNSNNYSFINQKENTPKIWTNNYRGNIVKSIYQPKDNEIYQFYMPYNDIDEYKKSLEKHQEKNNNFNSKIVNRNLELKNKFN